jgi:hypothetical protein
MKSLIERFFKKEPEFSYIIADYTPVKTSRLRTDVAVTEYETDQASEHDEMEIDKIYQSS